jgi:hypothetical protein
VKNQEFAEKQKFFIKEKSALAPLDESKAIKSAKVNIQKKAHEQAFIKVL